VQDDVWEPFLKRERDELDDLAAFSVSQNTARPPRLVSHAATSTLVSVKQERRHYRFLRSFIWLLYSVTNIHSS